VHTAIAGLEPGDPLAVRPVKQRWQLLAGTGEVVGRLAAGYTPPGGADLRGRVHALATWSAEASEPEYRASYRCDDWEVVVPELIVDGHDGA
jgi:ATP-dependent DNA helicase RecQ